MKYICLSLLILVLSACSEFPENSIERTVTLRDNYTHIDTATVTTTTDVNHVTNNETLSNHTIYVPNSNDNTTSVTNVLSQSIYDLSLKGGLNGTTTIANWNADNLTALDFHIHGDVTKVAVNQTGIAPADTSYITTDNGFFNYNLSKVQMGYIGATVNPDNISQVNLIYQTKIYTFIQNSTTKVELEPIVYTLNVN